MKNHKIYIIVIALGILTMVLPLLQTAYYDHKVKVINNNWQQYITVKDNSKVDLKNTLNGNSYNKHNIKNYRKWNNINNSTEGILKIDKIDLKMPILKGANEENLKISLGSVCSNVKIDDIGNYCIAGHRSHKYGRKFNRLGELEVGDKITLTSKIKTYEFVISEKFFVKPNETRVLASRSGKKEITLITCDPIINPYQRLIIKGVCTGK